MIGKRLSRLGDTTNQVLSIAAVIGREFRLDVLQAVAGVPSGAQAPPPGSAGILPAGARRGGSVERGQDDALEAALAEATERAVIEQRQTVGTVTFRFTHAFFRQTLYEEIFIPRRIRWHQQVARALKHKGLLTA